MIGGTCLQLAVSSLHAQLAQTGVVTNFHQFHSLSAEQAAQGKPIRIRGVVLCYDQGWNQVYIHDGTEVCWLSPKAFQEQLEVGQYVEMTGATALANEAPSGTNLQISVLGHRDMPRPRRHKLSELAQDFGQWVEVDACVRVAETSRGRLFLLLDDAGCEGAAWVFGQPGLTNYLDLVGCQVRLRAINASKIVGGQLQSAFLNVPGMDDLRRLSTPEASPFALPAIPIDTLFSRELGPWTNRLVHVNGLIAAYVPGEYVVVKDPTGMVRANVSQVTRAHLDDRIDLWGYLSLSPQAIFLKKAFFEPVRSTPAETVETSAEVPPGQPVELPRVLTRVSEMRDLRPAEAGQHLPVRFVGVVTYADPEWGSGFLQDSDGAVFFQLTQGNVHAGQWVQLTGVTAPGGFTPEVDKAQVEVLGLTNLPVPIKVDLPELAVGSFDAYRVELDGLVRSLKYEWGHLYLSLMNQKGNFRALIPGLTENAWPTNLVEAHVRLNGACAYELNDHRQVSGVRLQVPGLTQLTVLEPAPSDQFSAPAMAVRGLGTFHPDRVIGRRVKIAGTVTAVFPDRSFCLQDVSGGIHIHTQETNQVAVGDFVEVLGFPMPGDFSPWLDESAIKWIGHGELPLPRDTTAERLLTAGQDDGVMVRLVARLLQPVPHSARPKLVLQSGPIVFTASVSDELRNREMASWPAGSLVRVPGVCQIQAGETHEPVAFRLLITRSADLELLQTPARWTSRQTLVAAAVLGVVGLVVLAWIGALRRQVRRQTELISKEKSLLATLIDHLPDYVFVKDMEGRYVLTNRAHSKFHGREPAAFFRGKSVFDLCEPELARQYAEADRQILSGQQDMFQGEEPARDHAGNLRFLLTTKVPLKDSDGKIVGLVGISHDVTQRKQAEDALQASERFTRSLVESLPQNILRKDLDGRFTFVNEVFCRSLGKPMNEILGKTDFDLYPPGLAKKFRRDDQEVIAKGTSLTIVEENRNPAGEHIYVEVVKTPLFDAQGRPAGLQIIFWDVTPRKKAEAQLAYERDLLNALLEKYPDVIYFKDLQSRFVRVSRSKLERSYVVALDRHRASIGPDSGANLPPHLASLEAFAPFLLGKTDFDFFEKARAQDAYDDEQTIMRTGQPLIGKVEKAVLPSGTVYWSLSTKMPWRDPEGRLIGTFGISKDITSIKEAEAKLESVHKQLVETSRQAGMAEVATRVLHNVGNVLNSVNVSATLLAEKVQSSRAGGLGKLVALLQGHSADLGGFLSRDPRGLQIPLYLEQLADRMTQEQAFLLAELGALIKNVDHIKNIVAMQQSYAKVAGIAELVHPTDLIEDALRINAGTLSTHRIKVRREWDAGHLPEICVDKHAVLQILVNLIRNAGHACEESNRLDRSVVVRAFNGDHTIKIDVEDNGVGIRQENLARIFSLGFTTRKGGHGFGLHSGALAAKELGGALRVRSDGPGRGATFTLDLPVRTQEPSA